jgi:hypothetical protein
LAFLFPRRKIDFFAVQTTPPAYTDSGGRNAHTCQ